MKTIFRPWALFIWQRSYVNSRLDTAKFLKVAPCKGTALGDNAMAKNPRLREIDLKHFSFYDTHSSICVEVGEGGLQKFIKTPFWRFYLNPARVWRILRKYPNFWHTIKNLSTIYKYTEEIA